MQNKQNITQLDKKTRAREIFIKAYNKIRKPREADLLKNKNMPVGDVRQEVRMDRTFHEQLEDSMEFGLRTGKLIKINDCYVKKDAHIIYEDE